MPDVRQEILGLLLLMTRPHPMQQRAAHLTVEAQAALKKALSSRDPVAIENARQMERDADIAWRAFDNTRTEEMADA